MSNLKNILGKIENVSILKAKYDALIEERNKELKQAGEEVIQELKNNNFIYQSCYVQNFTSELENFVRYYNSFYSAKVLDFLLPNLFEKCLKENLYFEVCCIEPKFETKIMFVKATGVLRFVNCNELSEKEYSKLLAHSDKEELLKLLLTDKESGEKAKKILSN